MPATPVVRLHAQHSGNCSGRPLDKANEGRHDTRDHGQDRRHNNRQCTGLLDSEILRHHLADDDMAVGHQQESQQKAQRVQDRGSRRSQQRPKQREEDFIQGVFTCPAEPKARQSHPNLSDGKQFLRSLQQSQGHPGRSMPLIRQMPKLRFPNRKQSHFSSSKEGIGQKDQTKQSESGNMAGARHYELKV